MSDHETEDEILILDEYYNADFENGGWIPNFCPLCGEEIKDKGTYGKCSKHGVVKLPLSQFGALLG